MTADNRRLRVAVIFGGRSGEHEVSLLSARAIMAGLDPARYEVIPVGITKEGYWLTSGDPHRHLLERAGAAEPAGPPARSGAEVATAAEPEILPKLVPAARDQRAGNGRLPVDVVFPVLHGPFGEDGTIQGMLELAGIPYVGAGVLASAVGMDKALMKVAFAAAGLPIVDYMLVRRHEWEQDHEVVERQITSRLPFPVFVKPANLGSSVGITKVREASALHDAIAQAARYDRRILVERGVDAREIEVSVLGNEEPIASLPGEVLPYGDFYDYAAKYLDDRTSFVIPAHLPPQVVDRAQSLAITAFRAIDCAGMARVDFFLVRPDGPLLVNEINTIPGFTRQSVYPKLWEASGLGFNQLVDRLVELALERHADRVKNRIER